jgi:hypothetical protein
VPPRPRARRKHPRPRPRQARHQGSRQGPDQGRCRTPDTCEEGHRRHSGRRCRGESRQRPRGSRLRAHRARGRYRSRRQEDLEDLEDEADTGSDDEESDDAATPTRPPGRCGRKSKPADAAGSDDEEIAEPSEKDKASGDFVWDEEESEALRQARKDAELTASADSVRAYLKQIGKVALLNAEEEVELAKRIEAGLYATQLMGELTEKGEKLPAAQRRT